MFVDEEALDYDAIFSRGGQNLGDEDFALFKCPNCHQIFLIEYEADTIYLDAKDLSVRQRTNIGVEQFVCTSCSFALDPGELWIGENASSKYRVSWSELENSDWSWIASKS